MGNTRRAVENLEELVLSGRKPYVRYEEGAQLYEIGINGFQHLAWEACAVRKIGNVALVNIKVLQEYINSQK